MAGPRPPAATSRPALPLGLIGALLVGVALALVAALLLGGGSGGLAGASESPTTASSQIAVASLGGSPLATAADTGLASGPPSSAAAPTANPTVSPTQASTPAPTAASTPKPTPRPTPTPAPKPKVDSFSVSPNFIAACSGGETVTLTWTTSNATEVRVAIDPQGDNPINHVYEGGLAPDGSLANVPASCSPPNHDATGDYHEYVVIAVKGSAYAWRSIKVYVHPAA